MTMAGNAFRGLYRSLVPSLFVVTCVMSGVQDRAGWYANR